MSWREPNDLPDLSDGYLAPSPPGPPGPPGPPSPPGGAAHASPARPGGAIGFQGQPGQAVWTPPGGAKTSGLAIASFVAMFIFMPVAVIMAFAARSQIKRSNGALKGEGWANAVLIIFGIAFALLLLALAAA